jgi:hypothetical protein
MTRPTRRLAEEPQGPGAASVEESMPVSPEAHGITVYTPKGKPIEVRADATVLEFARRVHMDFVALVKGARINRERVTPLAQLKHRDVVYLDLARAPRPLPSGWEDRVNDAAEVKKISDAFAKAYRGTLERRGRADLQRQLIEAGAWPILEEPELDEAVREALGDDAAEGALHILQPNPVAGFYQEIGLAEARRQFAKLPYNRRLSDHELAPLVLKVFRRALGAVAQNRFPSETRLRPEVRLCQRCCTTLGPVLAELTDEAVIFHRKGEHCTRLGLLMEPFSVRPPQYIYIEARERGGLAADVGAALETAEVGLTEFIGKVVGNHQAVLRLRIDSLSRGRIAELLKVLGEVDGVERVCGPEDPVRADEKLHFPDRDESDEEADIVAPPPPPYDVGPLIKTENRLYGRQVGLRTVHDFITEVLEGDDSEQRSLFVHGPFKIGKSSLVATALGTQTRARERGLLWVRLDAARGESWSGYSQRLARLLAGAARKLGYRGVPPDGGSGAALPLHELTWAIRRETAAPLVIAVDEVTRLFHHSSADQAEARDLALSLQEIKSQPRVALVLIGPRTSIWPMDEALLDLIKTALPLSVEPLDRVDTGRLLRARKSRHSVYVVERIAERVYSETRGHPYWIQALADAMWRQAARGSTVLPFNTLMFNAAVARVARDPLLLSHYYTPFKKRPLAAAVLGVIVEMSDPDRVGEQAFSIADLERRLSAVPGVSKRALTELLADMTAIGTIFANDAGSGASHGWAMPPVLVRHLRETGALNEF